MAMYKYGAAEAALTINGIVIQEFGDTDPAITIEDIDPRSQQKRGIGGSALRIDNVVRGQRLTVNLMPGSDEVRQLIALDKSGVDITGAFRQIGTDETQVFFDGIIESRGPRARAGKSSVSDEQFVLLFNDSDET